MSFVRNNALIGFAEVLCRLPLVFTVGYLARSIGPEIFGNWLLILAFQTLAAGVAGLGLSSSLSRFVPVVASAEASAYLRYAFILGLAPILIAVALAFFQQGPIGRLLGLKTETDWLLPVAVVMAGGSVADGFFDAFFKARMAVGRQICFVFARTLVEVIAVLFVFRFFLTLFASPTLQLAAYVSSVVAGKIVIYPWLLFGMTKGDWLPPSDRRHEFLRYGLPMVPTLLLVWLIGQSDRLVLSHFVTKSDLGIYGFAASLASYTVLLGYAVYPLLLPRASQLYDKGDNAGVRELFKNSQRIFVTLWACAMLCLALWSAEVIAWTGGSAFLGAANALLILCFAAGIERVMGIYQYVFHLVKRTDLIFWLSIGNAAIMIAGLCIAGVTSGIEMAPWAVLGATLSFNIVRYRIALRYLDLPLEHALILKIAALAGGTALLANISMNWSLRLAITVPIMLLLGIYVLRRGTEASGALAEAGVK
jgi:O-antigen/teichoic acid export membrane protein